jgi:uncharacterized protein (TIGR02145 family)
MKKIYFLLSGLLLTASVLLSQKATAQAPQKMSYQSVLRNSSNVVVANTQVRIKISVLQGSATGTPVYIETQTPTTNANGLIGIQIGTGTISTGTFAGINWAAGPYFIKTETDPTGGTNYTITGTQEMLSAPYAMYAAKSGDAITRSTIPDVLPTIPIGTQQWQAKNLDVAFYRNGDPIPQVKDAAAWAALTTGAWCWYNNDSTNGAKYGKLYNWYAVNDARGLAPQGWHIPTDAEWTTLSTTLGGEPVAGGKMKEAGTISWAIPITGLAINGNNSSGFAGLPGGVRDNVDGAFYSIGDYGYWWSATENSTYTTLAWRRYLDYNYSNLGRFTNHKGVGLSVRCLRQGWVATTNNLAVGQSYEGGIIAYILQPLDPGYDASVPHGIIAAPSDQGTGIMWFNGNGCLSTGATGTAIGTGNVNTAAIVLAYGTTGSYAAKLCSDLVLNGKNDWHLPSKDELNKLYINRALIGGFVYDFYWSSSETTSCIAWGQNFYGGTKSPYGAPSIFSVRAVRAF